MDRIMSCVMTTKHSNNVRLTKPSTDSEPGENLPLEIKSKLNRNSDFYNKNSSSMNNARITNPIAIFFYRFVMTN